MPPAPTVQSLNDIIGQITSAQAPEQATIDSNIQANDTSGTAAVAGLNAAKDTAFGGIEQAAQDKGMYFSGFSPDAEAKYTGSTYLPALAKLQDSIETTKNTLLGQKADLQTQANTQALTTQQGEQKDLDSYNEQQASEAQQAALQKEAEQAALQEAETKADTPTTPSLADQQAAVKASLQQDVANAFTNFKSRPSGYTESTILPQLIQAYSSAGVPAQDIVNAVYSTRKALGYG